MQRRALKLAVEFPVALINLMREQLAKACLEERLASNVLEPPGVALSIPSSALEESELGIEFLADLNIFKIVASSLRVVVHCLPQILHPACRCGARHEFHSERERSGDDTASIGVHIHRPDLPSRAPAQTNLDSNPIR